MIPNQWVYLIACLPLLSVWIIFFLWRKDVRREMVFMSSIVGLVSVATAYYWWTIDWWHPATITGTRVGVEDFVMGFFSGGIMAVAYEVLLRRRLYVVKLQNHHMGGCAALLFLAFLTSWLFWGVGITSFYASTMALIATAVIIFWERRDLIVDGLLSGVFMTVIAASSYCVIQYISPTWIQQTYHWSALSGVLIRGVPIEEFIFWFLAGVLFGPFYEYVFSQGSKKLLQH